MDANENNVTILVDGISYLFETDLEKLVLGYYYRRKSIQERYDKLYGKKPRIKRKTLRKLGERVKKQYIRWKLANIIVRTAYEKQYAIVLEKLGKKPAQNMIKKVKDKQLRHRIYQASFRGVQKAIEEKAREYGVAVIYINPRNTSKLCHLYPLVFDIDSCKVVVDTLCPKHRTIGVDTIKKFTPVLLELVFEVYGSVPCRW